MRRAGVTCERTSTAESACPAPLLQAVCGTDHDVKRKLRSVITSHNQYYVKLSMPIAADLGTMTHAGADAALKAPPPPDLMIIGTARTCCSRQAGTQTCSSLTGKTAAADACFKCPMSITS